MYSGARGEEGGSVRAVCVRVSCQQGKACVRCYVVCEQDSIVDVGRFARVSERVAWYGRLGLPGRRVFAFNFGVHEPVEAKRRRASPRLCFSAS